MNNDKGEKEELSSTKNNREEGDLLTNLFDLIKERIESPFFITYLFFWMIYHNDFLFYLALSEDYDKVEKVTNWTFGIYGTLIPLFIAVPFCLIFSPVSNFLAGARYKLTTKSYAYAKSCKKEYENYVDIETNRNELASSQKALAKSMSDLKRVHAEYEEISLKAEKIKTGIEKDMELSVYKMLTESIVFFRENPLYEKSSYPVGSIKKNSVIMYELDGKTNTSTAGEFFISLLSNEKLKSIPQKLAMKHFTVSVDYDTELLAEGLVIHGVWDAIPEQ